MRIGFQHGAQRIGGHSKTIYLQRVTAGRQDVADGAEIASGVVALKRPADWEPQRIDL